MSLTKIKCTKCKAVKACSPDRAKKLIGQFGSEENVIAQYVCRDCRKKLNLRSDGKMKPEKRQYKKSTMEKDEKGEYVLPESLKMYGRTRVTHIISDDEMVKPCTCHRPDVWYANRDKFENDGSCNGCTHFEKQCGDSSRNIFDETTESKPRSKRAKMGATGGSDGDKVKVKSVNKSQKITCCKCKSSKAASGDRIDKLLAKFGSIEAINASYVCRDCK